MAKEILIKPLITEKAERLSEGQNQYTFVVNRKANKIEIKKAVESMYSVDVEAVNTMVMPAKAKSRNTHVLVSCTVVSLLTKKQLVTLASGEEIDFFGEI